MGLIEIAGRSDEQTFRQRWSHLLTLLLAVVALLYGLNLRSNVLNATTLYNNVRAGISANYPMNWLIDEQGSYVFRVRDMSRMGFKTTIQVETVPIGLATTEQNVLTTLNINRPQFLNTYNPIAIRDYTLPDESSGKLMTYTFVSTESNPFLEAIPTVVIGQDVLTIRGGQAIIITFLADSQTFDQDIAIFNRFLRNLEFQ